MDTTTRMVGAIVSHYQLEARIGAGAFATVYKARDLHSGRIIAVKILRHRFGSDAEFVARFRREAKVIQGLPSNPHLVKPVEHGEQGETHFIAMEYIEGSDLDQLILQKWPFPLQEALDLTAQIADALACAHRGGVTHRDVKPRNIKVTPSGVATLMDFGLAKAAMVTRLTPTGAFIGTPQYTAPEICLGDPADPRSDVYSLGTVLYEILAGHPPFEDSLPAVLIHKHLFEEPKPLNQVRRDVPAGVNAIVLRAMKKQPEERYINAAEMLEDLRNWRNLRAPAVSARSASETAKPFSEHPSALDLHPAKSRLGSTLIALSQIAPQIVQVMRGSSRAYLVGYTGDVGGFRYDLTDAGAIFGRAANSQIALQDDHVSHQHARVTFAQGQFWLHDLKSLNGTYVNGIQVREPIALRHGDQIQVGSNEFSFLMPQTQMPANQARVSSVGGSSYDDRLAAAIAHGSIMLLPIALPLVIWRTQKNRSAFATFQAKQALVFQTVSLLVLLSVYRLLELPFFALIWLVAIALGLNAAYRCYQGFSFRLPIVADWIRS